MKKIILSVVSMAMVFSLFFGFGSINIQAAENPADPPIIEPFESDWPDYNYGNWQDIAKNPQNHQKVLECVIDCIVPHATAAVADKLLQKILSKGFGYAGVGVVDAISFVWCVIS